MKSAPMTVMTKSMNDNNLDLPVDLWHKLHGISEESDEESMHWDKLKEMIKTIAGSEISIDMDNHLQDIITDLLIAARIHGWRKGLDFGHRFAVEALHTKSARRGCEVCTDTVC